jgi:hypothetical protein
MSTTIDLAGQRFGNLTVNSQLSRKQADNLGLRGGAHWHCTCDCGECRIVFGRHLRSGKVSACSTCTQRAKNENAGARQRIDVSGERYGMLVAICYDSSGVGQGARWLFACDCGNQASLRLKDVRYGNTLSCGCLKHAPGFRHGQPKLMQSRPWRDTPTTFAKSFEAECAGTRIGMAQ